MAKNWSLRRVIPDDSEHVAAHGAYRPSDVNRRAGYAAWVRPRIESGHYVGWLAVAESGEIVGGAGAVVLDWGPTRANPGGRMARVVNMFVEESSRRTGIARDLLEAVLASCEALGIREFNLAATPEARSLYAALGFADYPAEMRRRVATP